MKPAALISRASKPQVGCANQGARWRPLAFAAIAAFAVACSPPEEAVAPPQPAPAPAPPAAPPDFRAKAPEAGPPVVFVPPKIEEARLSNGIRVLVVERRGLPIVAVDLAFDGGADQAVPGVGSFAGAMLMRGTQSRNAAKLSDELAGLGAHVDAHVDFDAAIVSGKCLTERLAQTLAIMADVAEHPAFAKDEIERERSRRLTALGAQKDRSRTILSNAVAEILYPAGHPYASPLLGTEDGVKKITAKDLQAFHRARFSPSQLTIAVSGDIDKAHAVAELEKAFGKWNTPAKPQAFGGGAAAHGGAPKVLLIDRPGASQSSVSVAAVGMPRKATDYDAVVLMNAILGGQFSSRINMNLREAHAYTYGAYSSFDFRHAAGPFTTGGEIVREKTAPAIAELLKEIDRMRKELVSQEELDDAKAHLVKQLPARFETVSATASTLAGLAVYGLPLDEFATRPARWGKITREDVQRAANAHLVPAAMHIVVVGDAKAIKADLEAMKLGDLVVRAAASK